MGAKEVVLVGHSMGGLVVLEAARRMPDRVRGIVPVDILLDVEQRTPPEQAEAMAAQLEADYKTTVTHTSNEYLFTPATPAPVRERVLRHATEMAPGLSIALLREVWLYDPVPALREIQAPVRAVNADKFPTNLSTSTGVSMKPLSWLARGGWALLALPLSLPSPVAAQECTNLPDFPTSAINTTQDRDQMMCQLGRVFPTLPVRQGTEWPWNDPTAPTNAWPTSLANPEGNWTDAQRHTVVRTRWGNWHTYDGDPMFNPDPSVHFPNIPPDKNGGAMSGYGDYGPYSNPRYTDIDLLTTKAGAPVSSREDWWIQRRPEIFHLVQQQLYGTPLDAAIPVSWTVTPGNTGTQNGSDGMPYAYREKTIVGTVDTSSHPELRNTPVVRAVCRYPAEAGRRVPVVITYGEGTGRFQYTAPYGIGTCSYTPTQVQPDSGGANLSSYVIGLANQGQWRKPSDPGSLVAWGWGVSRLIDAFANDPDFDGDKVAVEGHSRFGKATLVTAAYDSRVAVAWPSDAGALGTAMIRRTYGESLDFVVSATNEYHWLAGNAMNYAGAISPDALFPRRVEYLDVDSHSTTALIAPRAIFVSNGTDTPPGFGDAWADPRGCWLSGHLASPVWEHLGWKGQVIPEGTVFTGPGGVVPPGCTQCQPAAESIGGTPPFDVAFIEGTVGWRRQKEGHTSVPNWPSFMLFASRYLNDARPAIAPAQAFVLGAGPANVVGTVQATDADGDRLAEWQVKGGSGAYTFAIDPATGQITIADASAIDFTAGSYDLTVMVGDGKLPSHDATVTITIPAKVNVCHKNGKTLSISKVDVPDHVAHGDAVGRCE